MSVSFLYTRPKHTVFFFLPTNHTNRDFSDDVFDGILLPDNTKVPPVVTQMTPTVVQVGQRYGVPYWQSLGKTKKKKGNMKFIFSEG